MDFLWISIIFHRISSGFPHLEPFSSSLSSPSSAEVHPTGKGAKCDPLPKEEVAGEKLDGIIAAKFGTGEFSAANFRSMGCRNLRYIMIYNIYICILLDKTDTQFDNEYDYS